MLALASLASLVVASLYVRSVDDKKWSLLTVLKKHRFCTDRSIELGFLIGFSIKYVNVPLKMSVG